MPAIGPIAGVLISGRTRVAAQAAMQRAPFDTMGGDQTRGFLVSVNE